MGSNDSGVSRRIFLKVSGAAALGGGVAGAASDAAAATAADTARTVLPYPKTSVGAAAKMAKG